MLTAVASQAYLRQLQSNPLRTKMLTSGALSGLQEFLASWIAHDKSKTGNYFTSRVPKMALYGAFVSAPMGHVLISTLQWVFKGRTSVRAKVMQILASNLIVSVILVIPAGRDITNVFAPRLHLFRTPFTSSSWPSSPALVLSTRFEPPSALASGP